MYSSHYTRPNSQFPSSEPHLDPRYQLDPLEIPPECGVVTNDVFRVHDQEPSLEIEFQDNAECYNNDNFSIDDIEFCENAIFGIDCFNVELDTTQLLCEPNGSGVIGSSSSSPVSGVLDEQVTVAPKKKVITQWTQDQHKLFLLGLKQYGKSAWKDISRNFVKTRTPIQVASHAQKSFLRQLSTPRRPRKRPSINDLLNVDDPSILDLARRGLLSPHLASPILAPPIQPAPYPEQHPVQNAPNLPIHRHIREHHVQNVPNHSIRHSIGETSASATS